MILPEISEPFHRDIYIVPIEKREIRDRKSK